MRLSSADNDLVFRSNLIWLLVAQAVCILPLLIRLPLWIWGTWFFAVVWRVQIHRARWRFPSFWLKLLLGLGIVGGIYLTYRGVTGVEPMIGFLVCSFILKIVEMRSKKDALIVVFIGFITIAAQFLFAQSMLAGLYGLLSLFVLLAAWQAAFLSCKLPLKTHLQRAAVVLGQSLPLMLLFFVVMPRLGPLWSVPVPQGQGKTGFSETLQLGDIGELVKSPAIAFRASFISPAPSVKDMYWRGLALDVFDGRTWQASDVASSGVDISAHATASDFDYSVVMEPHYHRWLFSLGFPLAAESSQLTLRQTRQKSLLSRSEVSARAQYRVRSNKVSSGPLETLDTAQQEALTQLPAGGNPRARALARRWLAQGLSGETLIAEATARFSQNYWYTLRPPPLGSDAIDDFLFTTQKGFCEHFASSFVFLMRAAGIPARLMVGYQGGEFNEVESYYIVRQSNAHAWAEVWLAGEGWRSVDPTAFVAPSRIEFGLEDALAANEQHLVGAGSWRSGLFNRVYQRLDALEYSWNRWVLNYDSDQQEGLFKRLLGMDSPWRVGLVFTILCAILLIGFASVNILSKKRVYASAEYKLLQPLMRRLQKRGIHRQPGETIGQLAERIAGTDPSLATSLQNVDYWYSQSVYAADGSAISQLKAAIQNVA